MIIKTAEFVISNTDVQKCPVNGLPEYAFIGRSNVGKSSLINMLTNRKNLAMTSSKPGKTLLINHFIINNNWYLVDLPGYGFATTGKSTKDKLRKIIDSYILLRDQLTCLFLLIDCRHEPQKIDVDFMNWLGISGVPFSIVFTKADKLTKSDLNIRINSYKEKLMETWEEIPPVFITSADTAMGKEELLNYIDEINSTLK
jgi:GTP-binding protein